jgi:hypothetical protein
MTANPTTTPSTPPEAHSTTPSNIAVNSNVGQPGRPGADGLTPRVGNGRWPLARYLGRLNNWVRRSCATYRSTGAVAVLGIS